MRVDTQANKMLEPTRVGVLSSAIAGGAFWSRVAELERWPETCA